MGTAGVNYDATQYGYDADGRQSVEIDPQGTITITVFGDMGASEPVGGTDDHAIRAVPGSPRTTLSPSNMIERNRLCTMAAAWAMANLDHRDAYPGGVPRTG